MAGNNLQYRTPLVTISKLKNQNHINFVVLCDSKVSNVLDVLKTKGRKSTHYSTHYSLPDSYSLKALLNYQAHRGK